MNIELFFIMYIAESRNKTISLRLMWDAMPLTGRIYVDYERKSSFTLPGKYKNN